MTSMPQYESAIELERALGDPMDPDRPFSFAGSMTDDESEDLPEGGLSALEAWGLQRFLVPASSGGALTSFDELALLMRLVSRRDLTVAIATGQTFLGTVGVWIDGSEAQRDLASRVVLGGGAAALALSEREHGSDIAASDVTAREVEGGFSLDGEKWLINNATRGRLLSVFARSREGRGLRGFTVFLVDKEQLAEGSFECLPKIKTLGIRGADISGLKFKDARIDGGAVIKRKGAGLHTVLRGLCITRTLCSCFSLGAFDTALRTTLDFATSRRLYGAPMLDLDSVQRSLVDAFTDLIICEAVARSATRMLHVSPGQVSVNSAIVKYFVPTMTDEAVSSLAETLGARYYLRDEHNHGIFQKMQRDNAVVGLFDGCPAVNLTLIAKQLPQLVQRDGPTDPELVDRIRTVFDTREALPRFEPDRLALDSYGRSDVLDWLGTVDADELSRSSGGAVASEFRALVEWQADLSARVEQRVGLLGTDFPRHEASFQLAREYCALHAAASCLESWLVNRDRVAGFDHSGDLTRLAVKRLSTRHGRSAPACDTDVDALAELARQHRHDLLFSASPLPLGGNGRQ